MGGCLSKKSTHSSCPTAIANSTQLEKEKAQEETVKKEIFIIKHRKSHEINRKSEEEYDDVKKAPECSANASVLNQNGGIFEAAMVRTSSCTKEELDAILIQCGRLSRSSSTGKANLSGSVGSWENNGTPLQRGRYSGSKRSCDFDNENGSDGRDYGDRRKDTGVEDNAVVDDDNGVVGESSHRHMQRQRQSRTVGSPSKGRRRTPSREREQQRSGSRERGSGRRVSRSPGRRFESPITSSSSVSGAANSSSGNGNGGNGGNGSRPGKMVSVPSTVSSLVMDKSNIAAGTETISAASAVKRIQVKRNAGGDAAVGSKTAASQSLSPARTNVKVLNEYQNNQNQSLQQPGSLSRSNSRKTEHSPYRRNALSEIDTNVVTEQMPLAGTTASNTILSQASMQKSNSDHITGTKVVMQGTENKIGFKGVADNNLSCRKKERQQVPYEVAKAPNVAVDIAASGFECLKHQAVTRCRSSRLSRDFDINPETLSNASPSYTALFLEDIQNFHQKSSTPAVSLPPCLSKACSILEAVADLNSTNSSNLSSASSEDKRRIPTAEKFNKLYDNASFEAYPAGKKGLNA